MRTYLLLATTALLAACGGGGGTSSAPPPLVPPPAGGGTPASTHSFASPTDPKTYVGIGGFQVFEYQTDSRGCCDQQAEIYAGNSNTLRDSGASIAYDPRSAVFTLKVNDPTLGANFTATFQDPASRTDFGGLQEPQWGTPQLANPNIGYLQAGDGDPRSPYVASGNGLVDPGDNNNAPFGDDGSAYQASSLFYLKPGTETQYVSFAGYARNDLSWSSAEEESQIPGADPTEFDVADWNLSRGAFAFGEVSANSAVPKVGTGAFRGSMLASMIYNPTMDGQDSASRDLILPSFFQWIEGTASLDVNFDASTFDFLLNGTVMAPQFDYYTNRQSVLEQGTTFTAHGLGTINLVNFGGFKGQFDSASFTHNGAVRNVMIAGSAIDGAFYGPAAQEAGGGFRIVGGNPDERIDILGAFVGKK